METIELEFTREQELALIHYAVIHILEENMEAEIDKEIAKIHAVQELEQDG